MKTILVAAALLLATTTAHAEVKKGEHFVELDAKAGNGKAFRLKDMAGKWVMFGFNASWCGPCKKELPALDKIAPKLAGKVRRHRIRVVLGDRVTVAVSPYDPTRGLIVFRAK